MSVVNSAPLNRAPRLVTEPLGPARPTWLVHPAFDLLLVCNLLWPAIVLAVLFGAPEVGGSLSALQIYFLSTPHRWITLVLVFGDRNFWQAQPAKYTTLGLALLTVGGLLIAIGGSSPAAKNPLMLLMMVDYVWNAWHFAAQHAGIARIYARLAQRTQTPSEIEFEKGSVRLLVLWVFFRLALHIAAYDANSPAQYVREWLPYLVILDPFVLIGPIWVLIREFVAAQWHLGRMVYLLSMVSIYSAQLLTLANRWEGLMQPLFIAGASFHALEYLAIVAWSMGKKQGGIWTFIVPRLAISMLVFMATLGISGALLDTHYAYHWAVATLLVSLLHYGYDGLIWRAPTKPRI
jgi:hypothetical protein